MDTNKEDVMLTEGNLALLKELKSIVYEYKLYWDFERIYYVIDKEEKTFDDLRILGDRHEGLRLILLSGLPEENRKPEVVTEIMDKFRKAGCSPRRQHSILVDYLTAEHFFMDSQEMEELENLSVTLTEQVTASQQMIYELLMRNSIQENLMEDIAKNS